MTHYHDPNAVISNADFLKLGGGIPFQGVPLRPSTLDLVDPLYNGGNFGQRPVPGFQQGTGQLGMKWSPGYGVAGSAVGGLTPVGSTFGPTMSDLDELDVHMATLDADVQHGVAARGDVNLLPFASQVTALRARWIVWYDRRPRGTPQGSFTDDEQDFIAHVTANYNQFLSEYTTDRATALQQGLNTTAPAPPPPAQSLTDLASEYLPWVLGIAAVALAAPYLAPLLAGHLASR